MGFTGGYNLANEYFNFTHPYGQWKDTGIRLEGEAVRSLTVTFLEMWNAVSDKDKNDSDFTGFLVQTDYQAKQTGFIQPYADSGRHAIHQNIMAFTVILNIFNCYEFKIPLTGKFP